MLSGTKFIDHKKSPRRKRLRHRKQNEVPVETGISNLSQIEKNMLYSVDYKF